MANILFIENFFSTCIEFLLSVLDFCSQFRFKIYDKISSLYLSILGQKLAQRAKKALENIRATIKLLGIPKSTQSQKSSLSINLIY